MRSAEALAKDIPALLEEGINVEAGGHGLLTFRRQDLIVVSPGVPLDTPELVQVRRLRPADHRRTGTGRALPQGQNRWPSPAPTEKPPRPRCSARFLKNAGLPTLVGGNIGVPVVALIDESTDDTWSVLEVSSFQLESTVAVPSQDRRHPQHHARPPRPPRHALRTMRWPRSASSPRRIEHDFVVLNADNARARRGRHRAPSAKVYWFSLEHRGRAGRVGARMELVVFRAAEDAPVETVMPLSAIPLKGDAQC